MQAVDFDIHAGKDLDAEGFQLTHPDLNNTEDKTIDATKIRVGDKVRLRNGAVKTVTELALTGEDAYPVEVFWGTAKIAYTVDGLEWMHEQHDRDILEIIPAETSEETPISTPVSFKEAMGLTDEDYPVETTDDIVVKPSHYTKYKIEPVTFIMENRLSFEIGNIVKYACRAGDKLYPGQDYKQSRITDLRKVMRYAEMEINRLEGKDVL